MRATVIHHESHNVLRYKNSYQMLLQAGLEWTGDPPPFPRKMERPNPNPKIGERERESSVNIRQQSNQKPLRKGCPKSCHGV